MTGNVYQQNCISNEAVFNIIELQKLANKQNWKCSRSPTIPNWISSKELTLEGKKKVQENTAKYANHWNKDNKGEKGINRAPS